jgi:hypothetical protein
VGPPDPAGVIGSLSHALEAARRMRRPLVLVSLELAASHAEAELPRLAALTRRTVRDTDALWRDGERSLLLLLADADGPGSEPALARIRLRLRGEGLGDALMGRVAPAPGIGAEDLLVLAREDARPIGPGPDLSRR